MRLVVLVLLVLVVLLAQPAASLAGLVPVPPNTQLPTDPDGDGKYEDLNANARNDFADVVLYFNQMTWIAANEPLVAFDYNGNGRIDFADVVSLFNELGSGPTPTPTPTAGGSVSQVVNPSDADQTVRLDGSTAVIIPGGLLTAPQTITIQRELNPPASTRDGDQVLNAVRVSIGTLHTFSQELPIEMPFDPSAVPSGTDPASIIQGAYWDPGTGAWVPLPSTVDTSRRVVTVYTTHLSLIGNLRTYMNLPSVEGVHFRVHYDPNDDGYAKAYDAAHTFASAQAMAAHCAAVLDSAYLDYTGQGFRPPVPGPLDVNRVRVFVGRYDGDAFWSGKTGRIFIPVVPDHFERGVGGLDMELRHELFHAVQNRYWTVGTMHIHRWWTEATAEYASGGRGPELTPAYFLQPLTYDPSEKDEHKYQTAGLIEGMVLYGRLSFSQIWNYTAEHDQVYQSLDSLLKTQTTTTLRGVYRNWVGDKWSEWSGPLDAPNRTWPSDEGILDGDLTTMDGNTHHIEHDFMIPAEGTVRVWGISIEKPTRVNLARYLGISAGGGLPDEVSYFIESRDLDAYLDGREGTDLIMHVYPNFAYSDKEKMVFLNLVNAGTTNQRVRLSVDEPILTPTPGEVFTGRHTEVPVRLLADHIPPGIDSVRFYMNSNYNSPHEAQVSGGTAETVINTPPYDMPGDNEIQFSVHDGLNNEPFNRVTVTVHVRD